MKFVLIVWLMLPGSDPMVMEETPVASEADCINGVAESLDKIEAFAAKHKLKGYAFDVTCRAGDWREDGDPA